MVHWVGDPSRRHAARSASVAGAAPSGRSTRPCGSPGTVDSHSWTSPCTRRRYRSAAGPTCCSEPTRDVPSQYRPGVVAGPASTRPAAASSNAGALSVGVAFRSPRPAGGAASVRPTATAIAAASPPTSASRPGRATSGACQAAARVISVAGGWLIAIARSRWRRSGSGAGDSSGGRACSSMRMVCA